MENAEQAKKYIEKASKVLPEDDHNHEPIAKFLNSYKTAAEMADNDEKKAILSSAVEARILTPPEFDTGAVSVETLMIPPMVVRAQAMAMMRYFFSFSDFIDITNITNPPIN